MDDTPGSSLLGRVIGFGYVSGVAFPVGTANIVFSTSSSGTIASQNASATLGVVLPAVFANASSGSALTTQLFDGYSTDAGYLMYAPVLVDHYVGPNATGNN